MTRCLICNRRLINAVSVATGIGPICGNRQYRNRVSARYGRGGGWTDLLAWEKCTTPCYSCKLFSFPKKEDERTTPTGHVVTMGGKETAYPRHAIGGWCRKLKSPVDGNAIKSQSACAGSTYQPRRKANEQVKAGIDQYTHGQLHLFER